MVQINVADIVDRRENLHDRIRDILEVTGGSLQGIRIPALIYELNLHRVLVKPMCTLAPGYGFCLCL